MIIHKTTRQPELKTIGDLRNLLSVRGLPFEMKLKGHHVRRAKFTVLDALSDQTPGGDRLTRHELRNVLPPWWPVSVLADIVKARSMLKAYIASAGPRSELNAGSYIVLKPGRSVVKVFVWLSDVWLDIHHWQPNSIYERLDVTHGAVLSEVLRERQVRSIPTHRLRRWGFVPIADIVPKPLQIPKRKPFPKLGGRPPTALELERAKRSRREIEIGKILAPTFRSR